ncbi:DNA-binding MurR/RpiR family transcriptional regulator [Catenibacillus scindens]|uniref:DNA-binding MurR/RpiR family transcriptional regulator n=1 Tax=Catenibacillus scindens TaxID=673271 RepID=A0A7W8HA82_9FIRM|nr:MurR/RpiR family transcriptional regulator [Catenibacillus scindens]MBB5264634.1 DNA-binding MurR/RpiR family transcriptional regulator [Catenibacillus scindens]
MNVLMSLISLYNRLPAESTYRAVIKGILNNLDQMADATIFDMAEITSSSRTTIWRMLKMIGYNSYGEFHHELKKIITQYSYYNRALPVDPRPDFNSIVHMASGLLKESSDIIIKTASESMALSIVQLLRQADHISFYDFPNTSTDFLIQNLIMTGKDVGLYSLWPDMNRDAGKLTPHSVVFAYPIESQDMKDMTPVFEKIRDNRAILILADEAKSRYASYADYVLLSGNLSLEYPLSRRYIFEMLLIIISELYREKYISDKFTAYKTDLT